VDKRFDMLLKSQSRVWRIG